MLSAFETPEQNEEKMIARITRTLQRKMERDYPAGSTKRDAHPKHLALLHATFTVEPHLPPQLQAGLFSKPMTYDAWVRFSNASGTPQTDQHKDVRGCAIKLLQVGGEKIPESDESGSQDFVLVSMPTMPLGTLKLFHDAICIGLRWSMLLFAGKMLLTGHAHMLRALRRAKINPSSMLDLRFWSTTPYLFGPNQAAKYSLIPTTDRSNSFPPLITDTYLIDDLQEHLLENEATFDFMVQLRTDPATMPIENAAVEWQEQRAPFIKVATLHIPVQEFRTAERDALAEALAFSPAHALTEHRPLGAINRARMRIYKALADFRRQRDKRMPIA